MKESSSTKRDIKQLEFIVKYCNAIEDTISLYGQIESEFFENIQFQYTCAFAAEHIGECVKQLSKELISKHPEIEWKDIARFRDLLSHDYPNVNLSIFWSTLIHEVPPLKKECESILYDLRSKS